MINRQQVAIIAMQSLTLLFEKYIIRANNKWGQYGNSIGRRNMSMSYVCMYVYGTQKEIFLLGHFKFDKSFRRYNFLVYVGI